MHNISIDLSQNTSVLSTFANKIKGIVTVRYMEELVMVDNSIANGILKYNNFNNGISVISFDISFTNKVNFSLDSNLHPPVFLIYSSQGEIAYSKNDKDLVINNYQNVIIGATKSEKHHFKVRNNKNLKTNIIIIDRLKFVANKISISYLRDTTFNNIFEISEKPFLHFGSYSLKIEEELHKYRVSTYQREDLQAIKAQGHIFLVLALHFSEYNKVVKGQKSIENLDEKEIMAIKKLTAYIENNISENVTVSSLVTHSGIHAKKLQMGFRLLYNKSVNEYIRELKLKIALHSLETTDETISEIVYKIGFRSRSYFSKIFLEYYGILPVDYKRKVNKTSSF